MKNKGLTLCDVRSKRVSFPCARTIASGIGIIPVYCTSNVVCLGRRCRVLHQHFHVVQRDNIKQNAGDAGQVSATGAAVPKFQQLIREMDSRLQKGISDGFARFRGQRPPFPSSADRSSDKNQECTTLHKTRGRGLNSQDTQNLSTPRPPLRLVTINILRVQREAMPMGPGGGDTIITHVVPKRTSTTRPSSTINILYYTLL